MHIVATNEKEEERKRSRKIPRVLAEATEWIMLPFSEIAMPERIDLCVWRIEARVLFSAS